MSWRRIENATAVPGSAGAPLPSDARLSGLCLDALDEEKVNRLFNQSEFYRGFVHSTNA
jgi:hypothetical protein